MPDSTPFSVLDHRRWPGFTISCATHLLMLGAIWYIDWPDDRAGEQVAMRVYSKQSLTLHLPERLHFETRQGGKRSAKAGSGRRIGAGAPAPPAPGESGRPAGAPGDNPAPARSPRPPRKRFELPEAPRRAGAEQTLLQLNSPPDMAMERQVPLPTMMFWSQEPARVPKPQAKAFVLPGRKTPERAPAMAPMDAPPRLEPPNLESTVTSLKVASSVVAPNPALPRPPGTTMPIRIFQPPAAKVADGKPIIDVSIGEAINVLALSPGISSHSSIVSIPGGNQIAGVAPPPDEAEGEVGGQGGSGPPGERAQAGTGRPGSGGGGGGLGGSSNQGEGLGGAGKGAGPGYGSGRAGAGFGADGADGREGGLGGRGGQRGYGVGQDGIGVAGGITPARGGAGGTWSGTGDGAGDGKSQRRGGGGTGGAGSGAGAGSQAVSIVWGSTTPIPYNVPVRMLQPNRSAFDVLIQATASELGAEAEDALSGRPVYMVYLPLGTAKQWILQYCQPAPREDNAEREVAVVQLTAPSIIKAPFPLLVYKPPLKFPDDLAYMLVHGQISAEGRIFNLRVVRGAAQQVDNAVLSSLEKWEFRPASQDGMPVPVEILLAIPPDRS
jgi:hypothetical protein